MPRSVDVVVLGAGVVGVSAAVQLALRGREVALIDRGDTGRETSFGNAGLIQDESILPYMFPRRLRDLVRYAINREVDAVYHRSALPRLARPFLHYYRNSGEAATAAIARARAPLIRRSVADHLELATLAGAPDLLHATGWTRIFRHTADFDAAAEELYMLKRQFGLAGTMIAASELGQHEPALSGALAGGMHWSSAYTVRNPLKLTQAYLGLLEARGGRLFKGDAGSLDRDGQVWTVQTEEGPVRAAAIVIALGPWSVELTKRFGYSPLVFVKRGYHVHFKMDGTTTLRRPILDDSNGYCLAPMDGGLRLTTGVEFAHRDATSTPVQLMRAEPKARGLVPTIGQRIETEPWIGARPCTPDMLPIIGRLPGSQDLWCLFGHAHHGLTLGPTTGKLLAEMMVGEETFTDPSPYAPERLW